MCDSQEMIGNWLFSEVNYMSTNDVEIADHNRYAIDKKNVQEFYDDYHIEEIGQLGIFPAHTNVLDYVPKPAATDGLFQVNVKAQWACFRPPQNFLVQRHFFFEAFQGSEVNTREMQRINLVNCMHEDFEEERQRLDEKDKIQKCCKTKANLQKIHADIKVRIYEFVQG